MADDITWPWSWNDIVDARGPMGFVNAYTRQWVTPKRYHPLAAEGAVVFAKACELGLEGIVSKRAGSFYRCGLSRNWRKAKNPNFVRT